MAVTAHDRSDQLSRLWRMVWHKYVSYRQNLTLSTHTHTHTEVKICQKFSEKVNYARNTMKYLFKMFFPVVVCTTCDSIDHMHACSETRELEGYGDVKLPPKKKKKKKMGTCLWWSPMDQYFWPLQTSSSNQNRGVAALKHDHCWQVPLQVFHIWFACR